MVEKLLTFPKPVQRLARLAELGQRPGRAGHHEGKDEGDVPSPGYRDSAFDHSARLRPVALEKVERACGPVRYTDGERTLRQLCEADRLSFVVGCLGESAELGEAYGQPRAIVD